MKIGVLQFSPVLGEKKKNFQKITHLCKGLKLDLLVLPELATTGYLFASAKDLMPLAEEFPTGESSDFFISLAKEIGGFVVAGVAERDGDDLYNSAVLFSSKEHIGTYRKVHLFDSEKKLFKPGKLGFPVFDIGIATLGMMVCFDWIFPESARSLALQGADIICHPANLVLPYCPAAAITRAIENRVFFALADRIGRESIVGAELSFIGMSRIIEPNGNIIAELADEEGVITAEIDVTKARDKRITARNHIFDDRRLDCYSLD